MFTQSISAELWEGWFEGAWGRAAGAFSGYGKGKALRDAGDWEKIVWSRRREDAEAGEGRPGAEALEGGRTAGLTAV